MICPYCQLDKRLGHSEDCIIRPNPFTPAELVRLRAVRDRVNSVWDAQPMMLANGEPIPWLVALNIDPARFR